MRQPLSKRHMHTQWEKGQKHTTHLPRVAGASEDLRRVCSNYSIRTVLPTITTLGLQLIKIRDVDPLMRRARAVYEMPCAVDRSIQGEPGGPWKRDSTNIRRP